MIGERLAQFDYIYDQDALASDGETLEHQFLKLRAVDGLNGVFYQLVFPVAGGEVAWSFSESEDIEIILKKFITMVEGLR